MPPDVLITVAVLILAFVGLAVELWSQDAVLLAGLAAVTASGVIDLNTALQGFANRTLPGRGTTDSATSPGSVARYRWSCGSS